MQPMKAPKIPSLADMAATRSVVCVLAWALTITGAHAQGVDVGRPSAVMRLVPAAQVERMAEQQYAQLLAQAREQRALAPEAHPQLVRLRAIAGRVIAHANRFNAKADRWQWEVNLIGSKQVNAFCMPGGKIAFYTGILDRLKLTDDEIASVMGHEVAHALREHARARIAKGQLTELGASVLGQIIGQGRYADLFRIGGDLLTLRFSREDEIEADVIGLELAARAGYDPRAAVSLWQKMQAADGRAPPQWLSTHPSSGSRIEEIERQLPKVLPLYQPAAAR